LKFILSFFSLSSSHRLSALQPHFHWQGDKEKGRSLDLVLILRHHVLDEWAGGPRYLDVVNEKI
jgi:hypothetical protein